MRERLKQQESAVGESVDSLGNGVDCIFFNNLMHCDDCLYPKAIMYNH